MSRKTVEGSSSALPPIYTRPATLHPLNDPQPKGGGS